MAKEKWTLQEHLDKLGWIKWGMTVSNSLIETMVIRGFVNSSIELIDDSHPNQPQLMGVVDKDCEKQIVCSTYLYQIVNWYNGEKIQQQGVVHQIYPAIYRYEKDTNINVENLYIPDLITHPLYKQIRSRKGNGVVVTEQQVYKHKSNKGKADRWKEHGIFIKEGKAFYPVKKGDVIFRPCGDLLNPSINEQSIKSVAQEILAVCRYVHKETGHVRYAIFNLDELNIEID